MRVFCLILRVYVLRFYEAGVVIVLGGPGGVVWVFEGHYGAPVSRLLSVRFCGGLCEDARGVYVAAGRSSCEIVLEWDGGFVYAVCGLVSVKAYCYCYAVYYCRGDILVRC